MRSEPVAVLLPGAGSSADFVARAFGPPLTERGYALVSVPPVPGPGVVSAAFSALDEALEEYGPRLRLVGGVSLGAHVSARWAVVHQGVLAGLLLAFPAWTGEPGPVAAATAAAADRVATLGTAGALAVAGSGGVGWVAEELAAAWPAYGGELAATLRAAAAAPGPTRAELAALDLPVGLAACEDDPLHPLAVAEEWAAAVSIARVARLRLATLAPDRALLGAATLTALTYATRDSTRRS
ncbi:MAG TPA: alpha/beta hydrolase [Mycobacteriales bacterium]